MPPSAASAVQSRADSSGVSPRPSPLMRTRVLAAPGEPDPACACANPGPEALNP